MALITRLVGEPRWATDGLLRLLRPLLVTAPKYLKIPRKLNSIQGKVEVSQGTNVVLSHQRHSKPLSPILTLSPIYVLFDDVSF